MNSWNAKVDEDDRLSDERDRLKGNSKYDKKYAVACIPPTDKL